MVRIRRQGGIHAGSALGGTDGRLCLPDSRGYAACALEPCSPALSDMTSPPPLVHACRSCGWARHNYVTAPVPRWAARALRDPRGVLRAGARRGNLRPGPRIDPAPAPEHPRQDPPARPFRSEPCRRRVATEPGGGAPAGRISGGGCSGAAPAGHRAHAQPWSTQVGGQALQGRAFRDGQKPYIQPWLSPCSTAAACCRR